MAQISLDNAGAVGLVQDFSLEAMPVEAWNVLENVRCKRRSLEAFGTDLTVYDNGTESPRFFVHVRDPDGFYWLVATNGDLFKVTNIAHTEVSKLTTTYAGVNGSVWCGFGFHRHVIANVNSGSDFPQVLLPAASNFVDLTNWPANTYCQWMNSYKNFLIAYNITEGASKFPNRIKWSSLADAGALPDSWDETDLTKLSGESDEPEKTGGKILCARVLNDINYIYKDNGIFRMYPRNDLRVFNIKEWEDTHGILGAHAVSSYDKQHFVVLQGDVVINDGQRLTSIIEGTNRNWLFDNLHNDYFQKTQVVTSYLKKEIWICFADKTSTGWLNRALVWDMQSKTWSTRTLNDFSAVASGVIDTSDVSEIIDSDLGIIDLDDSIIDAGLFTPDTENILAGDPTGNGYFQLDTVESGVLAGGVFERHGLTIVGRDRFNEWKHSANTLKQVTRLYPKINGSGTFNIQVGMSEKIGGAITWSPVEVYTVGSTSHVDFMITGRVINLKIEPQSSEFWSYSGCDIDINVLSENTL